MTQPNSEPAKLPSFEESLAELETIVRDLEAGDVTLEEALGRYERGVGLLKQCYAQLRQAEQKVYLLAGEDTDGKPVAQPFEQLLPIDPSRNESRRRPRKDDTSY